MPLRVGGKIGSASKGERAERQMDRGAERQYRIGTGGSEAVPNRNREQ